MKQSVTFSIFYVGERTEDLEFLETIKETLKKYLTHESILNYEIPKDTEEYTYAHNLALQREWNHDWDEEYLKHPGVYVCEADWVSTSYSKKDF